MFGKISVGSVNLLVLTSLSLPHRVPFQYRYAYMHNQTNKNVKDHNQIVLGRYVKGFDKYNI